MPDELVYEAQHRSKCAACGEWIEEGDEIVRNDDGDWVHIECDQDG